MAEEQKKGNPGRNGQVAKGDFIEVEYTGTLLDGTVFDTTSKKKAQELHLDHEQSSFKPAKICVGERQVIPGLDQDFMGKEVGKKYSIKIPPELAFGKRDVKKVKIVPSSTFKEHKVNPQPGMQVDMDGDVGTVSSVSGGRIIVNFNHPLAGREVNYEFIITRAITDPQEQLVSFLNTTLRMPIDQFNVSVKENMAMVELPLQLPPQFTSALGKKLAELTHLKEVQFTFVSGKQDSGHEHHGHDHHHDHGDHHGHQH